MSTGSSFNGRGFQTFYSKSTRETVHAMAPIQFYDDFLGGDLVIPAAGAAESGIPWTKKIVGAGPPYVSKSAVLTAGGVAVCGLTATSEKQDAALFFDDKKNFDVTKGLVFEARAALLTLPSAAGVQAVFGVSSAWIDGPDNTAYYLEFGATASGAINIRKQDGVAQTSVASGVTLTASQYAIFKIDATDVTSVKFYIDGTQVGTASFGATGANAVVQPKFAMYKPSGTGLGVLGVDYVRIFQNR